MSTEQNIERLVFTNENIMRKLDQLVPEVENRKAVLVNECRILWMTVFVDVMKSQMNHVLTTNDNPVLFATKLADMSAKEFVARFDDKEREDV